MKLNVVELSKVKDFKQTVLSDIGKIIAKSSEEGGVDVHGSNVLLATYIASEYHQGTSILKTDNQIHQDRFQGKIGLVLKLGAAAFKFDGPYEFPGKAPKVGQYVMYHASDARELSFRTYSLRLIDSTLIRMTIGNPTDIY